MTLIVTKAPFRVSFAGGGTDLPVFYEEEYGAVLSTTINKYVYVIINRREPLFGKGLSVSYAQDLFQHRIRVSYANTENVQNVDEIKHPIVREALKLLGIDASLDISTLADVPAGTGLGSSSTFTVALLHGLHTLKKEKVGPHQLAEEAAHIELHLLKRPIGKQDHYAAAFGGLNLIRFQPNGEVSVDSLESRRSITEKLFPYLMLFYTRMHRDAGTILDEQQEKTREKRDDLLLMRGHAHQLEDLFLNGFNPTRFGALLHETWSCKKNLASLISNTHIDEWYSKAMQAGCLGGKLCGAGGGGFLLLVVDPVKREMMRSLLADLGEMEIQYEPQGSQVLFSGVGVM